MRWNLNNRGKNLQQVESPCKLIGVVPKPSNKHAKIKRQKNLLGVILNIRVCLYFESEEVHVLVENDNAWKAVIVDGWYVEVVVCRINYVLSLNGKRLGVFRKTMQNCLDSR